MLLFCGELVVLAQSAISHRWTARQVMNAPYPDLRVHVTWRMSESNVLRNKRSVVTKVFAIDFSMHGTGSNVLGWWYWNEHAQEWRSGVSERLVQQALRMRMLPCSWRCARYEPIWVLYGFMSVCWEGWLQDVDFQTLNKTQRKLRQLSGKLARFSERGGLGGIAWHKHGSTKCMLAWSCQSLNG